MKKMNLSTAIKNASKAAKKYSSKDKGNKLARLQAKESELVYRGNKAVDEGRDKKIQLQRGELKDGSQHTKSLNIQKNLSIG